MPDRHLVLTPEALTMMDAIERTGSFAAAARELGKVPSALTYNVRQLEEALDVLLFDRSSRQARFTAAGLELLGEGRRLLAQTQAVAQRVRRIATGWETQLSVALDTVLSLVTAFELCEAFYAHEPQGASGTRLRLRSEVLAGTWETLVTGQTDLAIGVGLQGGVPTGFAVEPLGELEFIFVVAPHHALAARTEPLGDAELVKYRAVAVADSAQRMSPLTVNLLPGQDVLTVASTAAKIEAQLRGLGCGYVPEPMVRHHIDAGRLVTLKLQRARPVARMGYAWRCDVDARGRRKPTGLALAWWLEQLKRPATRTALLQRHAQSLT